MGDIKLNINEKVFKQYDIRGIVKEDFSQDFVLALAKAFAFFIKEKNPGVKILKIGVGRDARKSGDFLFKWFSEGLVQSGVKVYDFGTCPTPALYYSLFAMELDGAVEITGSHNPPEYNGFKLCADKTTIFGDDIQTLLKLIKDDKSFSGEGCIAEHDILTDYISYQIKRHSASKGTRKLKVVVDAGNGTAGLVAPQIFKKLGFQVIELFSEPDGDFPNHHPDPTVQENLVSLQNIVIKENADIGFAFDGDSDRLGVVDETGKILWGDDIMIVLARDLLSRHPGAKVIGDVKCSIRMYDQIKKAGGEAIMFKTGHSLIKNKMKQEKALLAGEMSGHIFFGEDYFGFDDAVYGALMVANILAKQPEGTKMSSLLADVPVTVRTPEIRIECDEAVKFEIVKRAVELIKEHYSDNKLPKIKDLNLIDGVRVEFENGWGLLRASNTQPVLVSRFEASDKDMLMSYCKVIEEKVKQARAEF